MKHRDLLPILLSSVLSDFALNLWYYLLLPYLSQNVGLNEVEAGLLLSLRKVVGFMSSVAGGLLASTMGRRIMCIIANFVFLTFFLEV